MNYLFPLLAALIWGGNTIVTKLCAQTLTPIEISFYRWLLAVLVLTPFTLKRVCANPALTRGVLARLAVLGLFGGVIFQSIAYYAAHYTSATNMGIMQALVPLIALLLSIFFLRHRAGVAALCGLAVSISGVVLVVSRGDLGALVRQGLNLGDALMLVAVLSFATYSLLLNKWKLGVPLVESAYIQALVATLAFLPAYLAGSHHALGVADSFYVGFAGVGASILAPLLWMSGVNRLGAARVSLFFNLVPVITALLASVFLAEHLSGWVLGGGALAIAGVALAEFKPRRAA
ncbi:EamA family transporter [Duganella sp. FT80W]|uniref:EamA family transporter n=1 Tax=Duganella guangzhouensis TaxID=2666084 RepID=A0A6I2L527_9BURK|nr:DMT family transporter [Duganella guangzhouensis]MRW92873.1 EamA family transporter [Duganella guangzhouensis]